MIEVVVPGYRTLRLEYLVMDYNGTLAVDGILLPGVAEGLARLKDRLEIHVATADTFGKAAAQLEGLPCRLTVLGKESQDAGKLDFIRSLGAAAVAVGNGRNDRMMLKESGLGIAVILEEGAAVETLLSADIVCTSIPSALALLANPLRLTATLRS